MNGRGSGQVAPGPSTAGALTGIVATVTSGAGDSDSRAGCQPESQYTVRITPCTPASDWHGVNLNLNAAVKL